MLTVLVHGTAIEKRRIVARDGRKIRSHGIAARRAQPHLGRIIRPRAGLDLFGPRPRGQPQKLLNSEGGLLGGHGRPLGAGGRGCGRSRSSRRRGRQARPRSRRNSVMVQFRRLSPIVGTADHPRRVVSTVNHAEVWLFFWSLCALVSLVQLMANLAFFALSPCSPASERRRSELCRSCA